MPYTAVVSYYSALVVCQQPEQSLLWSIQVIQLTDLTDLRSLRACCDSTVALSFLGDRMCHHGQGVLYPLLSKVCERVDELRFSWFLEDLVFYPVCSVIDVARFAEVDWTDLAPLNTWLPYC